MNDLRIPAEAFSQEDFDDDDGNVKQRLASFVSWGESERADTTQSLSDRSWAKSSMNSDSPSAESRTKAFRSMSMSLPTLTKLSQDDVQPVRRHTEGSNKTSRRALLEMIASAMETTMVMDTQAEDKDSEHSCSDLKEYSLLLDRGIRLSREDTTLEECQRLLSPMTTEARSETPQQYQVHQVNKGERPAKGAKELATIAAQPAEPSIILGRTSSAPLAEESKPWIWRQPMRSPPKKCLSARSVSLGIDRDKVPRIPPRRRSSISEDSLRSNQEGFGPTQAPIATRVPTTSYSRGPSATPPYSPNSMDFHPMSGEELQTYAMARMPKFVQEQLPQEEWKRVFTVAAASQVSFSSGSRSSTIASPLNADSLQKHAPHMADDIATARTGEEPPSADGTSTVVSGLTSPASFEEYKDQGDSDIASQCGMMTKIGGATLDMCSLSSRSWHEGSSTHASAPTVPRRFRDTCTTVFEHRMSGPSICPTPRRKLRGTHSGSNVATQHSRSVCFSKAYVRYYERILEVNPSTRSGPSVGLGWSYKEMSPIDLNCVEDKQTNAHRMILPRQLREDMVRTLGYTRADVAKAVRQSLKLKNQRAQTYNNLRHQQVEYLVEKSKRKVGRLLRFGTGRRTSSQSTQDKGDA